MQRSIRFCFFEMKYVVLSTDKPWNMCYNILIRDSGTAPYDLPYRLHYPLY